MWSAQNVHGAKRKIIMGEVIDLIKRCNFCKRDLVEGGHYYKHPKFGIVCEYCGPFNDGLKNKEEKEKDEN